MIDSSYKQLSFYGVDQIKHLIDPSSFEYQFRELAGAIIKEADFEWLYQAKTGRPAIPPAIKAMALMIQRHYAASDREMEKLTRYHLAVKYALGIPMNHQGIDHSSLSKFRSMMIEGSQDKGYFEKFNKVLLQNGLIKREQSALIDTTHTIANIAIPTTLELIKQGLKRLVDEVVKYNVGIGSHVIKECELEAGLSKVKRGEERNGLVEVVRASKRLLDYLTKTRDGEDGRLKGAVRDLQLILRERAEEQEVKRCKGKKEVEIKEKEELEADRWVSLVDKEARAGRKSKAKKFIGYKAQIVESEEEFILGIEGMKGNRHDSHKVKEVSEAIKGMGVDLKDLTGDTAYGTTKLRQGLGKTQMIAPLAKEKASEYFSQSEFSYDRLSESVRCPGGEVSTEWRYNTVKEKLYFFSQCMECALKERCTTGAKRSVIISEAYLMRKRVERFNGSTKYKEQMKKRSVIERKNGELKNNHGFRRCLYWGLRKYKFQCWMTALVVNMKRAMRIMCSSHD